MRRLPPPPAPLPARTPTVTDVVTTPEAADEIGVSRSTLDRWAADGLVTPTAFTATGHRRWNVDDIKRQLAALHASRQP